MDILVQSYLNLTYFMCVVGRSNVETNRKIISPACLHTVVRFSLIQFVICSDFELMCFFFVSLY